jgi:hypothetical protein
MRSSAWCCGRERSGDTGRWGVSERREPRAWEFFRAVGGLWRAVADPQDMGGQVGRALRAGRVMWYEIGAPGTEPDAKLDAIEWVRVIDVEAVLDASETMTAHLRQYVREESRT